MILFSLMCTRSHLLFFKCYTTRFALNNMLKARNRFPSFLHGAFWAEGIENYFLHIFLLNWFTTIPDFLNIFFFFYPFILPFSSLFLDDFPSKKSRLTIKPNKRNPRQVSRQAVWATLPKCRRLVLR